MAANSNTYCTGPYSEVRINSSGSLNFCHAASNKNLPEQDHISRTTIDEYFTNSATIKETRSKLEDGKEIDRCNSCYNVEKLNLISFRNRHNLQFGIFPGADFEQSLNESKMFKHPALKPNFYHVSFSNVCNMACLMCTPDNSSLLATTLKQAKLIDTTIPILRDWTQGPAWQEFCDHICNNDEIVCLHIMGGEPLYHKRFKELLTLLDQRKHTDFHFTFVTNGSVYDPELIPLLQNFKSVSIEISLEGVTAANDYIRHGGNTAEVLDNINSWCEHRTDTFDIVLRSVPQALSVTSYDQLIEFALNRNLLIDSNILANPSFLKANILPEDIKQVVRTKLSKFIKEEKELGSQDINNRNRNRVLTALHNNVSAVLAQLDSPCENVEANRQQFADYCSKYDQVRGIHIKDYVPELAGFVNNYNYDTGTN